jgi:hypothetical protein
MDGVKGKRESQVILQSQVESPGNKRGEGVLTEIRGESVKEPFDVWHHVIDELGLIPFSPAGVMFRVQRCGSPRETMQKRRDFWRYRGKADCEGGAPIRWFPHNLPVEIASELFSGRTQKTYLDVAQRGNGMFRAYFSPLD